MTYWKIYFSYYIMRDNHITVLLAFRHWLSIYNATMYKKLHNSHRAFTHCDFDFTFYVRTFEVSPKLENEDNWFFRPSIQLARSQSIKQGHWKGCTMRGHCWPHTWSEVGLRHIKLIWTHCVKCILIVRKACCCCCCYCCSSVGCGCCCC